MATATPTKKATATKKAAPAAEETTAFAAGDIADSAQEYFSEFVSKLTDAAEDAREKADEFSADLRSRFEAQQKLATDVNADLVEAAKEEVSDAVQFASDLGKVKSFSDALDVQQAYWTKLFETRVARSQELTTKSVEAAKEAFAPFKTDFAAFDMSAYEKLFPFSAKA